MAVSVCELDCRRTENKRFENPKNFLVIKTKRITIVQYGNDTTVASSDGAQNYANNVIVDLFTTKTFSLK